MYRRKSRPLLLEETMIGAVVTGNCRYCALQGQRIVHARSAQTKVSRPFLGQIRSSRNVAIRAAEPAAGPSAAQVSEEASASESVEVAQEPEPIVSLSEDCLIAGNRVRGWGWWDNIALLL